MQRREVLARFWITLVLLIVLLGIGTQSYHTLEGWSYLDSAYFTVVTITTIGYGDFVPLTNMGKIFTMIFPFIGIGMALYLFSATGAYFFRKMMEEVEKFSHKEENANERKLKKVEKILKKKN